MTEKGVAQEMVTAVVQLAGAACHVQRRHWCDKNLRESAGDPRGVLSALQEFTAHVQHARVVPDSGEPPFQRFAIYVGA